MVGILIKFFATEYEINDNFNKSLIHTIFDKLKTKLEDRSQKKKIMFLHGKNKASRKGYKGEC